MEYHKVNAVKITHVNVQSEGSAKQRYRLACVKWPGAMALNGKQRQIPSEPSDTFCCFSELQLGSFPAG